MYIYLFILFIITYFILCYLFLNIYNMKKSRKMKNEEFSNKLNSEYFKSNKKFTILISLDKDKKKLSTTGGLRHAQNQIKLLINIANLLNRRLILPRPYSILSKNHSEISPKTKWSYYWKGLKLDDKNIKNSSDILKNNVNLYDVYDKNLLQKLKNNNSEYIGIHIYDQNNNYHYGNYYSYLLKNIQNKEIDFEYSNKITNIANKIIRKHFPYNTIHIRRGDIIKNDSCYGKKSEIINGTSIESIISKLKENKIKKVFIFSNEKDLNYLYKLKLECKKNKIRTFFENNLHNGIYFNDNIKDNYFLLLLNSYIAKFGIKHICTVAERMDTKCNDYLVKNN